MNKKNLAIYQYNGRNYAEGDKVRVSTREGSIEAQVQGVAPGGLKLDIGEGWQVFHPSQFV